MLSNLRRQVKNNLYDTKSISKQLEVLVRTIQSISDKLNKNRMVAGDTKGVIEQQEKYLNSLDINIEKYHAFIEPTLISKDSDLDNIAL